MDLHEVSIEVQLECKPQVRPQPFIMIFTSVEFMEAVLGQRGA